LKFFEEHNARLVGPDLPPTPLVTKDGTARYEIKRISNARTHKGKEELWVEWKGYNQSQFFWVNREILKLMSHTWCAPSMPIRPFSNTHASAPKRTTKGYKTPVASLSPSQSGRFCGADM